MKSLCSPALLFLVLMVIGIIMMIYNRIQPMSIVVSALFIVIWTWFLNFLCELGHEGISWFLVVMPFVLYLVVFSLVYETVLIYSLKEKESFVAGVGRRNTARANAAYYGDVDGSVEVTGHNGNSRSIEFFKGKKKH